MTSVIVQDAFGNEKKFSLQDMQKWFVQIRGFPSILSFGHGKNHVWGEGQVGGRNVTNIAKEAERKFVERMGADKYQKAIDKLMVKARQRGE